MASAFRSMCQAAILHWWTTDQQQALYVNSLLNFGNEQLKPQENAIESQNQPPTAARASQGSTFWNISPDFTNLLSLQYPKSALPADYVLQGVAKASEAQGQPSSRKRQNSSNAPLQQPKRSKPGSRPQKGAASQEAELSAKLQKRLAVMLELVTTPAATSSAVELVSYFYCLCLISMLDTHPTIDLPSAPCFIVDDAQNGYLSQRSTLHSTTTMLRCKASAPAVAVLLVTQLVQVVAWCYTSRFA